MGSSGLSLFLYRYFKYKDKPVLQRKSEKKVPPEKSLAKKRLLLYVYAKPGNIY
jgi:hypothetical protein